MAGIFIQKKNRQKFPANFCADFFGAFFFSHPVTVRKLPRIIRKLEAANKEDTVTAAMIRGELADRIAKMNATGRHAEQQVPAVRTIQDYLHQSDRRARRNRRKPALSDNTVRARLRWAKNHGRKPREEWERNCLALDEKTFHFYGTPSAKLTQRGQGKLFTYRTPAEGLQFATPSSKKHFTGGVPIPVLAVVAQGRVLGWKYYDGQLSASKWVYLLDTCVVPALAKMARNVPERDLFVLRDDAPQSHGSNRGKEHERLWNLRVVVQPTNSPDCQPLDFTLWKTIGRKMRDHVKSWAKRHPRSTWRETLPQFKIRLRRTALRLTKREVNAAMGKMRKVCIAIVRMKGSHISID